MAANEIHKDDYGTVFTATVKDEGSAVDISSATVKQFKFKRPVGTMFTADAHFTTDGTDGLLSYTIASGDLDAVGIWKFQGYIVTPSGKWDTDIAKFHVFDNLEID